MNDTGEYQLSHRELAVLRAVSEGHAQLLCGCEPDLAIDGAWCDHQAAQVLLANHLICSTVKGSVGQLVPATLTQDGRSLLGTESSPAA